MFSQIDLQKENETEFEDEDWFEEEEQPKTDFSTLQCLECKTG